MKDLFTSTEACISRLLVEYARHKSLIVAFDFDDTVYDYHGKGRTYERVLELLRRSTKAGFHNVVFTACASDKFEGMRGYLDQQGVTVSAINENAIPLPFGNGGKIYYNILLDDRAGLGQAVEVLTKVLDEVERRAQ
jgi:hydroxymethylpyrimidine pyrophosphatase-like HAD family hydrolase